MTETDKAIIKEIKAMQEYYERQIKRLNDRVDALVVEVYNLSESVVQLKKKEV